MHFKQRESWLNDITSNLAEGIYILDVEGNIVFMNQEAEHLLGWTAEELNRHGAHDLVHCRKPDGSHMPLEECRMHQVIKTGQRYASTDEIFVRRDGTVFPISVITSPIMDNGEIVASVTAFRDITERKQIERDRELLIEDLRKALTRVKTLNGLLPICASCKKIRDDKGYWKRIEVYVSEHSEAEFTHGICPECAEKLYKDFSSKT